MEKEFQITTLGYLQDSTMMDKEDLPLTITRKDGKEFNLINVIDNYVEHRLKEETEDLKLRNIAEISNMRKRQSKQMESYKESEKFNSFQYIIEVDDDVHQAMKMLSDDQKSLFKPISDKIQKILSTNGIVEMNPIDYNSDEHEVISIVPSKKSGVEVVSKGYKSGDRILRHPKVILFSKDA
jgi:molecular chaperone GrpE